MSRYYEYEDETDGMPVRQATSTRRYQPRIVDQYNDDTYEYEPPAHRLRTTEPHRSLPSSDVPARRTASRPPVTRQRVYQPPAPPTHQPEMSRRSFLGITRRGLFQTAGVIGGISAVGLGLWTRSDIIHTQGQLEEGHYAATNISLVCGHRDNSTYPTQLHAYLQPDGKINVIELPGGNPSKSHLNQTQSVREAGYAGDLADLFLSIEPVLVGKQTYQVHLHVEMHAVAVFPGSFSQDWMLVDSGKGYFETVNK